MVQKTERAEAFEVRVGDAKSLLKSSTTDIGTPYFTPLDMFAFICKEKLASVAEGDTKTSEAVEAIFVGSFKAFTDEVGFCGDVGDAGTCQSIHDNKWDVYHKNSSKRGQQVGKASRD